MAATTVGVWPFKFDYTTSPREMLGAVVTVPAGKTNAVRVTYLATRKPKHPVTVKPVPA